VYVIFDFLVKCVTLRSELDIARERLEESISQKNKLHQDLTVAENRCERLQSQTVLAISRQKVVSDDILNESVEDPMDRSNTPIRKEPTPSVSLLIPSGFL
jgi:hypothetical protein